MLKINQVKTQHFPLLPGYCGKLVFLEARDGEVYTDSFPWYSTNMRTDQIGQTTCQAKLDNLELKNTD